MAAEEFNESDLIFSNKNPVSSSSAPPDHHHHSRRRSNMKKKQKTTKSGGGGAAAASVPVNIPTTTTNVFRFGDQYSDEWFDEDEELVPPHVIVGRRVGAGKMAFSVCSGNGRTLKGRDLSEVRNSILRMTGFLET